MLRYSVSPRGMRADEVWGYAYRTRLRGQFAALIAPAILLASAAAYSDEVQVQPGIDHRDVIEKAVSEPFGADAATLDHIDVLLSDQFTYDNNLYRLPSGTDVNEVVGVDHTRQDHINTDAIALDGQRTYGQQVISFDAQVADNRYVRNTDLDNISSKDKLIWAWDVSDVLSGQLGAFYNRGIASFVNSTIYTKNVVSTTDLLGAGRYQIGPHWAILGAVYDTDNTFSETRAKGNDNNSKSVDVGTEYGFDPNDSIGFEYRYTDTYFPRSLVPADSDYREDTGRILLKYALSASTLIDASGGYLKRSYTIPGNRDFGGDVWRVTVDWQPSEKTKLLFDAWRKLAAYEAQELNYFVTTGGGISPVWSATEKLNVSANVSYNNEKYIGSGDVVVLSVPRHDTHTVENAAVTYTARKWLEVTLTYGHEIRSSNYAQFSFHDNLATANATFKF